MPEFTVMSGNPVQDAINRGHREFAFGTLGLTRHTFGKVGAGATVTGLVIAPFAPPVGPD